MAVFFIEKTKGKIGIVAPTALLYLPPHSGDYSKNLPETGGSGCQPDRV
ncbi:Uncharacterised protein [Moraxella lacunata]|uniref:Uncharacterized protein n=1 Tax=Moraxella lacunata TaxID=477 RepID=A0A378UC57_MORLA|nr:hypothetical protein [Moraxella lacunata]STZ74853.1 Uncharacterised protein [Moraxella lacunata]STZ74905.1 Uncharacterised protein [Moraxella lacunata]